MKIKETKDQKKVRVMKIKEMEKSKIFREKRGITLIALVITITILIILTGVTISNITGRDGILIKTKNASNTTNREEIIKLAKIDVFNEQMNNHEDFTEEQFKKILAKYFNYDPASQLPKDLSTLRLTTKDGKYNDILASEIYNENFSTNTKTVGSIKEAKKLLEYNTEITSDDKEKVTTTGNGHYGDSAVETGKTPTDKILNIFDLEGNHREWTLEAYKDLYRVARGGYYNDTKNNQEFTPSSRNWLHAPIHTSDEQTTRFTLYICNTK